MGITQNTLVIITRVGFAKQESKHLACGLRDKQNRLVVAKGEGGRGGKKQEFGISRGKLLYIEWVTNVVYSTGNYIYILYIYIL